jgi:hypothetical protein
MKIYKIASSSAVKVYEDKGRTLSLYGPEVMDPNFKYDADIKDEDGQVESAINGVTLSEIFNWAKERGFKARKHREPIPPARYEEKYGPPKKPSGLTGMASNQNKQIKIAYTTDQNRKKIDDNERKIRKLTSDLKQLERDVKKTSKDLDRLNLGNRRFWEDRTVFNSMQRKMERFEKMEQEFKKLKREIDEDIRKKIERGTRAQIQQLISNK